MGRERTEGSACSSDRPGSAAGTGQLAGPAEPDGTGPVTREHARELRVKANLQARSFPTDPHRLEDKAPRYVCSTTDTSLQEDTL